jgi:hypothetical protein
MAIGVINNTTVEQVNFRIGDDTTTTDNVYQIDLVKNGERNIVWRKAAVLPTVTFNLSRSPIGGGISTKVLRSRGRPNRGGSSGNTYTYTYRWVVTGFTITNPGANLRYGNVNFTFSSNQQILSQPNITANITNGKLTSLTINNGGIFAGIGDRNSSPGGATTATNKYYGESSPTGVNGVVSYTGTN